VPLPEVVDRVAARSDVDSELVDLDNRRFLILVTGRIGGGERNQL